MNLIVKVDMFFLFVWIHNHLYMELLSQEAAVESAALKRDVVPLLVFPQSSISATLFLLLSHSNVIIYFDVSRGAFFQVNQCLSIPVNCCNARIRKHNISPKMSRSNKRNKEC